jgi:hypothetical protein
MKPGNDLAVAGFSIYPPAVVLPPGSRLQP